MSNHIHVFIYLDDARELSEEEVLARVNALYRGARLAEALGEWKVLRGEDDKARASFGGPVAGAECPGVNAGWSGPGVPLLEIGLRNRP